MLEKGHCMRTSDLSLPRRGAHPHAGMARCRDRIGLSPLRRCVCSHIRRRVCCADDLLGARRCCARPAALCWGVTNMPRKRAIHSPTSLPRPLWPAPPRQLPRPPASGAAPRDLGRWVGSLGTPPPPAVSAVGGGEEEEVPSIPGDLRGKMPMGLPAPPPTSSSPLTPGGGGVPLTPQDPGICPGPAALEVGVCPRMSPIN